MSISWSKAVVWGLAIWVIMFAVVSAFVGFKAYDNIYGKAVIILIDAIVTFFIIRNIKPKSFAIGAAYGLTWVVIAIILEWLVTMRFNPQIFATKSLWVGYAVTFLVAAFGPKSAAIPASAPPSQPAAPAV